MDEDINTPDDAVKKPKSLKKEIISWILVVGSAVLISFLINNFIIVNATVPSGSMRNTIQEGTRIIAFRLSYLFSEPERFDVVVFRAPDNEEIYNVKRIIGMGGERIDIIGGQVFVNLEPEPLYDGFILEPHRQEMDSTFLVPEGHFFVLGDHRNDSHDSRGWINTYLPRENILGRAVFSYFPFNRMGLIR